MQNDILTAENAVLGACLSNPGLWQAVLSELSQDDLATEVGRVVWNAARLLDAESAIPDAPAIAERIASDGIPRDYLFELMEVSCPPSALSQNLETVRRAGRRRALANIGQAITTRAQQGDDPNTIAGDAAKALAELEERDSGDLLDGTQLGVRFWERIDRKTGCAATGLPSLDKLFGGGMLDSGLYIKEVTKCDSPKPSQFTTVFLDKLNNKTLSSL